MIYRSNLIAPDLEPQFRDTTICKVRPWSMGHSVLSDKDFEPDCCFMTHDEAAILYCVASAIGGRWADIGARTGWSTAHICAAACSLEAVDRELRTVGYQDRFETNMEPWWRQLDEYFGKTAAEFFAMAADHPLGFDGVVIDADHDAPQPLNDARGALRSLNPTGVIVFHDFWGQPIRDGVRYLMEQGLKCRVYNTPAGMAVCWRGDFTPPDHVADPSIDWVQVRINRAPEFDWSAVGGV